MTGMFQSSSTAVGQGLLADFEGLLAVLGLDDLETHFFEDAPRDLAHDAGVIDDKACFHFRSSPCLFTLHRYAASAGLGCQFEHAIDIEDDHELAVEAVDAAGELGHAGVEVDGVFFLAVLGQPQHLADLVDQQAIGFAAQVDADRHRRLAVVGLGQPEPGAHVDHGDDAAAQVEDAGDLRATTAGTRVSRSGMNTSCTREIGRPNSWPPITAVTYSATRPSAVSFLLLMRSP